MRAEDWPQFRGRDRDGVLHEKGLAESFPADGLKVRWRKPVGWGLSSPVILGGRVFVTDSELKQPAAKERVLCFAEKTGEPLWTFSYDVNYPEFAFVPGQGVRTLRDAGCRGGQDLCHRQQRRGASVSKPHRAA